MDSPSAKLIISGDLPIRTTKAQQPEKQLASVSQGDKALAETMQTSESGTKNKPELQPDASQNEAKEMESAALEQVMTGVAFKKRKNRRSKGKRGLGKPTGFEEYHTDGPITPSEHKELREIYSLDRPFLDRIEEALMRFQQKRRIEPERTRVFHKYLQYGGITVGPNFGTGLSAQDLKAMGDEEALKARCQTALARELEGLKVNFDKVARGFLSSHFVQHFNPDTEDNIKLATVTLRNFYTFLLYHEVCPEYHDDIERARKTCDLAQTELQKNLELVSRAPGVFNKACSMLFGGHYFIAEGTDQHWTPIAFGGHEPLTFDLAREAIKFGIAAACSHESASQFQNLVNHDAVTAEQLLDIDGFEVLAVTEPTPNTRDFYHEFNRELKPVGKIQAKSFRDPAKPDIDMSPEERWEWDHGKAPEYEFEFLLEMDLLPYCYPGLKVITSVWKLNCGVYYFDEMFTTYPSFYTVLANDVIMGWKRPKEIGASRADEPENAFQSEVQEAVQNTLKLTRDEGPGGEEILKKETGEEE